MECRLFERVYKCRRRKGESTRVVRQLRCEFFKPRQYRYQYHYESDVASEECWSRARTDLPNPIVQQTKLEEITRFSEHREERDFIPDANHKQANEKRRSLGSNYMKPECVRLNVFRRVNMGTNHTKETETQYKRDCARKEILPKIIPHQNGLVREKKKIHTGNRAKE